MTRIAPSLTENLRHEISIHSLDCEINDPSFARACAEALLKNIAALREEGISAASPG